MAAARAGVTGYGRAKSASLHAAGEFSLSDFWPLPSFECGAGGEPRIGRSAWATVSRSPTTSASRWAVFNSSSKSKTIGSGTTARSVATISAVCRSRSRMVLDLLGRIQCLPFGNGHFGSIEWYPRRIGITWVLRSILSTALSPSSLASAVIAATAAPACSKRNAAS